MPGQGSVEPPTRETWPFSRAGVSPRWKLVVRLVLEWAVFLAAASWITWPLAAQFTASLPLGCEEEPVVPLLNLWIQWWNVESIDRFYTDYWRAPIFFPATRAFIFSEPQPLAGLGAWLLYSWLPSPEGVYNTLLWLHLALNGWCTSLMFRSWRCSWLGSMAAGLMVEWMPAVHWQLGVVQLVPLWGALLTLMFLLRFSARPSGLTAIGLGLSAAATYLLCSYYGLMLGVLVVCALPLLFRRRLLQTRALGWVAAACLIAAISAGPVIREQWRTRHEAHAVPPRALVAELSAHPLHLLRTPWSQWFAIPGTAPPTRTSPWAFSPGTLKLVLAGVAVCSAYRQRRRRRLAVFWLVMAVLGCLLAMGPTLAPFGYSPYDLLVAVCPGYAQLRNIHRFATFAQLALIVLAGLGLEYLGRSAVRQASRSGPIAGPALRLAGSLVLIAALFEAIPAAPRIWLAPSSPPRWVTYLQDESNPADVIAVFPLPVDETLGAQRSTALAMYWQMRHKRSMVNGYSGMVPSELVAREARLRTFPSREALAELLGTGVDLVVIPRPDVPRLLQLAESEPFRGALEQEFLDPDVAVFRLRGPSR
jgi:hypothetical protein